MINRVEDAAGQAMPRAFVGLESMRETLRKVSPDFEVAEASVVDAAAFCASVRDELRKRRKDARLDQSALGTRLGLSQSAISKIESGRGDLGLETLYAYAEAVGLRPAVIFVPTAQSLANQPSQVDSLSSSDGTNYAVSHSAVEAVQIAFIRTMTDCIPELMSQFVSHSRATNAIMER